MTIIDNITYGYRKNRPVFRDLTLKLGDGRIYGLLGMNGSGKTTLLKLLSGMLFPDKGRIMSDGENVAERSPGILQNIFMMPAEFRFGKISLDRFIALNSVFYPAFDDSILKDCLAGFGIGPKIDNLDRLSSGEKKKVLACIAMSFGTKILLMDEPVSGMDIPSRTLFRKLLVKHLRDEQTVIISAHEFSGLENIFSDVLIVRNDGTVYSDSIGNISVKYACGTDRSDTGALYSEPCAGGYRVIRKNISGIAAEIPVDILFNAVLKGAIR